ncbi:glycine/betaine ABC transporter permease [Bacillus sp. FJAT-27264]|uniref:ABC transporter permease n=1 Tax=Paenibacillus sp. (strain DSM 101736 / FJAT-27264) TaxID=1850362 RepID=UPI000807F810|nr:ABC transporter permease [Bacillus sp. FJAT-27264]OBZ15024.1 glycine/betaine ABC transporter permease [Bacillus sp. FJAT-27264]
MLDYFSRHYDDLLISLWEHIVLTFVSLLIAMLIALPLGYWLARRRRIAVPVLSVLSIIYAIPSLGMFALLIPFVGLGAKPAIIALVVYSQLILVRNVISGFQGIEPSIIEVAKGMGYSAWRQFVRIELPLALPVILGGLRIASVSVIGITTIAAWINAGGLGGVLFEGLYQNSIPKMVWGTLLVSLLALSTNMVLLRLEKITLRRSRGEQRV